MKSIKLHGIKLIIPLALIAGFVAGSFSYGAIPATASGTPNQSIQNIKAPHGVNQNGETYGSGANEQGLDLMQAKGVDGTVGYIKTKDLNKDQPNNPQEAVDYMKKMENSAPINIPLYDVDGKTVIGKFKIDTPEKVEITNGTYECI
ncbi:MAG TPA: hypothetical protein VFC58_04045 [Desulfosporosinus sp.]|nr:hypothetical protein [Desulfosporosinus sp.]